MFQVGHKQTFKCSFILVTFVSRFFTTKHLLILIMLKFYVNVPLIP